MEMIECAGYNARISPAACLARYKKAHETPDPLSSGYVGLEKCLACGIGMKLAGDEGPRVQGVKGSSGPAAPGGNPSDPRTLESSNPTKICKICRAEKPMTEFQRHNFTGDGRHTICRDCHREKIREKSKARIKKHPPAKTRACKTCGEEKPLRAFAASPVYADGYNPVCSTCVSSKISAKRRTSAMEKQEETRTCKTCGVNKPIEEFNRHNVFKDRRMGVCRSCLSASMSKRKKRRRPAPEAPTGTGQVLRLVFDGHEDLFERLKAHAAAEIRTPEQQVLYWIKQCVEAPRFSDPVVLSDLLGKKLIALNKGVDHARSV